MEALAFKRQSVRADETFGCFYRYGLVRRGGEASSRRDGKMSESSEAGSGKARKRQAAKAATRPAAAKVKATIHLSVEADQRLTIHAAMTGKDRSELVELLINRHCRRFVVSDRGGDEDAVASGDEAA